MVLQTPFPPATPLISMFFFGPLLLRVYSGNQAENFGESNFVV